jgi:hypothetical protein
MDQRIQAKIHQLLLDEQAANCDDAVIVALLVRIDNAIAAIIAAAEPEAGH